MFSVKLVDEAGDTGFRAYVDSDKNFVIECAYFNAFDKAFDQRLSFPESQVSATSKEVPKK